MIAPLASQSHLFAWVILPILIFLSRIADVSIGTVRVILVSRRLKYLAPFAGFFPGTPKAFPQRQIAQLIIEDEWFR
jgi:hypothetical protein